MSNIIGFPRKCRGTELSDFAEKVRSEVDESLRLLGRRGRDLFDVAASLNVDRKTLTRWRTGANEPSASKLLALRALVGELSKKAVGA